MTIRPKFVQEFSCWGSDCPASCCHSWQIPVDKRSFKQLRKHSDKLLLSTARSHLKRHKDDNENYGLIQLKPDMSCPFLDTKGLCIIHSKAGHKALPTTCQVFPRRSLRFYGRREDSLSLACHAAAHSLLNDPEAMLVSSAPTETDEHSELPEIKGGYTGQWPKYVRDFCFDILVESTLPLPERLFVMGLGLKHAEEHLSDPVRLEQLLTNVLEMARSGEFSSQLEQLPKSDVIKWRVYSKLEHWQMKNFQRDFQLRGKLTPQEKRFLSIQQPLLQLLKDPESTDWDLKDDLILSPNPCDNSLTYSGLMTRAQEKYLKPYYAANPQAKINYLLHYIYHTNLHVSEKKSPFEFFKIMMCNQLLLDSYLAGLAIKHQGLSVEIMATAISSYSAISQHRDNFIENAVSIFDEVEKEEPVAIFTLIK